MISYYLVDPDQDSSKYQKLGEISESKFKNLENRKEDSLKKDTTEEEMCIRDSFLYCLIALIFH